MVKILTDDNASTIAIVLDKKEAGALIEALVPALTKGVGQLNKRSSAYKVAKFIDDELPIF